MEQWAHLAKATVLKTLDTVVLHTPDDRVVKLYRPHRRPLVERIPGIGQFLKLANARYPQLRLQAPLAIVPEMIDYGQIGGGKSDPRWLVVYPWREGKTVRRITPQVCFHVGQKMAQLHLVAEQTTLNLALTHIDAQLLADILVLTKQSALFEQIAPETQRAFTQKMNKLEVFLDSWGKNPEQYGLIHSDLHFSNWIRNGTVLTPIDFDELAYGHYLTDLAVVCNEIRLNRPVSGTDTCEKALLHGYQKHRKLPEDLEDALEKFKLTALTLYLNWLFLPENKTILREKGKQKFVLDIISHIALSPW
jgi:Ser/Thr protein kinase RdoA (MazF antagonist)